MALADVTISFDLHQILGADFDGPVRAVVVTNVESGTLIDTSTNEIRMGSQEVVVASDGTGSWTTWAPGADGNPTSWQETLVVSYRDAQTRQRATRRFGPFTLATSANLADVVEEQEVPAEYLTQVTELLDGYVTEAEAARDAAVDISGISTSDGVVSALVEGTGGAGPLTRAALSASFAGIGPQARLDVTVASLPTGTEYVWNLTDGAGVLLDIVSGVA